VTEVNEDGNDDDEDEELIDDEADSTEDELQKRFDRMTFVVGTRKLEQLPQCVEVTEVFTSDSDAAFLKRAAVSGFEEPNYERYSQGWRVYAESRSITTEWTSLSGGSHTTRSPRSL